MRRRNFLGRASQSSMRGPGYETDCRRIPRANSSRPTGFALLKTLTLSAAGEQGS
jgi:hypothetical protein